jgi:ribosomal protein L37AE/L43A
MKRQRNCPKCGTTITKQGGDTPETLWQCPTCATRAEQGTLFSLNPNLTWQINQVAQ